MDDVYKKPGHLIRRAHQISSALFAEECGAFDLTAVQYAALVAIRDNPAVDATRLSTLIAFDRSTLGDVLERLEAKGRIRRSPSPGDRRVKLLHLSKEGEEVLTGGRGGRGSGAGAAPGPAGTGKPGDADALARPAREPPRRCSVCFVARGGVVRQLGAGGGGRPIDALREGAFRGMVG